MSQKVVHQSKFRNVFGQPFKRTECYEGVQVTTNTFENNFCCVNPKFLAICTKPKGCFAILPLEKVGRVGVPTNVLHSGFHIMDLKWNPFNDNILATASDDGTIKIWFIPDSGEVENLQPVRVIDHHRKRVSSLEWHPTAKNILASGSFDQTAAVYNIDDGDNWKLISATEPLEDLVWQVVWDWSGERLFTISKDQHLSSFNPRTGELIQKATGLAHDKKKIIKLASCGRTNCIATTGFSARTEPELKVWSMDDLDSKVAQQDCGEGSGCLFPFFDYDTSVIFLAPKGEGSVRYWEIVGDHNEARLYQLFQYAAKDSQRALCAMPKRGLNTEKCEIMRFFKVFNSNAVVEPISFIVPRRVEGYQEDLYPDTPGPEPALTGEEWAEGKSSEPILISLKDLSSATTGSGAASEMTAAVSAADQAKEIESLKAEVEKLQEELKEKDEIIAKLRGTPDAEDSPQGTPTPENDEEMTES